MMENTTTYNIPLKLMDQKKEKKHRCEKCNKDFIFKSELEKHYRTELHKQERKKHEVIKRNHLSVWNVDCMKQNIPLI